MRFRHAFERLVFSSVSSFETARFPQAEIAGRFSFSLSQPSD
jgi:hypothetical protein